MARAARSVGVMLATRHPDPLDSIGTQSHRPAQISVGVPTDPSSCDWWVIADDPVRFDRDFLARIVPYLGDEPTCLYTDFHSAADRTPVSVGGWSVERARWQDYTGPVAVIPGPLLGRFGATPSVRVRALRADAAVRWLPEPFYQAPSDPVRLLTDRDRLACWPARLPYHLDGMTRRLDRHASVSIVIPTRGSRSHVHGEDVRMVEQLLGSLGPSVRRNDLDLEIVLVLDADGSHDFVAAWRDRLGPRLVVLETEPPFNFATKINTGAEAATGEFLVLLNDDIEPVSPDWLDNLVALAAEPDVGAVGAQLRYEDGSIQHAGHLMAGGGVHLISNGRIPDGGYRGQDLVDRDVSGVTAACLVQRREVWQRLGGMDPVFPVSFNDVDYCERIRAHGMRIVQCNRAVLTHFESRSRPAGAKPWEVDLLRSRWADQLDGADPFTAVDPAEVRDRGPRFARARHRTRRLRDLVAEGGVRAVRDALRDRN